jgi:hypothetical protein
MPMKRREFMSAAVLLAGGLSKTSPAAAAKSGTYVSAEHLHGRRALVLQNSLMRIAVLPGGGFIGEVSLKSSDPLKNLNPMRVPHYQTIDPYTYDVRKHGARYGTGIQRRLMSGYMGHFTCFPQFAASSPAEFAADYGQHGEAIAVEWKRVRAGSGADLALNARLPITQYAFDRNVRLLPDETVAYVTETATNLVRYDRPLQWVQHATFGPDFVEVGRNFADASAEGALLRQDSGFKLAPQPARTDPMQSLGAFGGHSTPWLMQRMAAKNCVTLYNSRLGVCIGYIYEAPTNPWLLDYQENRSVAEKPWDNQVVMRGLCFGDSITPGVRKAVTQNSALDVPTYSWIEARGRITRRYAIFLADIEPGFKGVAEVRTDDGAITLVERETRRERVLKAAQLW